MNVYNKIFKDLFYYLITKITDGQKKIISSCVLLANRLNLVKTDIIFMYSGKNINNSKKCLENLKTLPEISYHGSINHVQ